MESKNDRKPGEESRPAEQPPAPAPRKRFRLERLEERIAPKKSSGSSNSGSSGYSAGGSIY